MTILHVSSEKSWRGGEQQIAYLIHESRKAGVEVELLVRRGSPMEKWGGEKGILTHSVSFSGLHLMSTALRLIRVSQRVDLLHVHSGKGHDVLALAYAMGLKKPSVLSRRVDFPVKDNAWAKRKYNLIGIKRILCVSDAIRDMIRPALSQPKKAITVHSGVDLSRYKGLEKSRKLGSELFYREGQKIIGVIAALAPHKDLFTFIDTIAVLRKSNLDFKAVIIGEGELRKELMDYASSKGLEEWLTFLGFREDVMALIPELDVFLITSKTEGLGTSIIDAMACGTPVVATAAGGITELVIHEKTGLLCPIGDEKTLAKAVMTILDSNEIAQGLVENASRHIQDFSYQKTAKKTLVIYKEVISEGR